LKNECAKELKVTTEIPPVLAGRPPTAKAYKSEASMVIHDMTEGLYENGIIDKITMKEFDDT
jgi:hypothetical protein